MGAIPYAIGAGVVFWFIIIPVLAVIVFEIIRRKIKKRAITNRKIDQPISRGEE